MPVARVEPPAPDLLVDPTPPTIDPINPHVIDSVFGDSDPFGGTRLLPMDLVDVTPIDPVDERWFWRTNPLPAHTTGRLAKSVSIFPGHRPGGRWSLDDFLVFMNELSDEWDVLERFRPWTAPNGAPGHSFSISLNHRGDRTIRFHMPCGSEAFGCVTTDRETLGESWQPCLLTNEGVPAGRGFTLDIKPDRWTTSALMASE
jgi:hypothetical protein